MDQNSNVSSIEKVFWVDIRQDLVVANPQLTDIIDKLDPGKEFPLYLASYPYGASIVEKGRFLLPPKGTNLMFVDSNNAPDSVKNDLKYSGRRIPAGIVLDKSLEVFIERDGYPLPRAIYSKGACFAMWSYLDAREKGYHPHEVFNITSGARSICMLPNIGDSNSHRNLVRDFNIRTDPPKQLREQWEIFLTSS